MRTVSMVVHRTAPRRDVTGTLRHRFVFSGLLATIALFIGSTVLSQAQTNWTGQFSRIGS